MEGIIEKVEEILRGYLLKKESGQVMILIISTPKLKKTKEENPWIDRFGPGGDLWSILKINE